MAYHEYTFSSLQMCIAMNEERPSLLEFPCQFPIKVMGRTELEFDLLVIEIIRQHVNNLAADAIKTRSSKSKTFVSVSFTIFRSELYEINRRFREITPFLYKYR